LTKRGGRASWGRAFRFAGQGRGHEYEAVTGNIKAGLRGGMGLQVFAECSYGAGHVG
jgi:hypothetical protein